MKKKNGFTLIELLGVIIIISILTIIVFPKVSNSVKNNTEEIDNLTTDLIYKAASLYIDENSNDYIESNNTSYCITISELVSDGKLDSPVTLADNTDITNTKSVQIYYDDGYSYELKNNNECVEKYPTICTSVTSDTKTTGNEPPYTDYNIGDEYICEVSENTFYNFFILSVENKYVNLIMDRNILRDGTFASDTNTGLESWNYSNPTSGMPETAIDFLEEATSTWNNVQDLDNYTFYSMKLTGKARLPQYSEIKDFDETNLWMYNYLSSDSGVTGTGLQNIEGIYGYWLMDVGYDDGALCVSNMGSVTVYQVLNSGACGIRPVIRVRKAAME